MVNKFKNYYNNKKDQIKTSMRVEKDSPFFFMALLLIFFLGILIRMSPITQGSFLIKAFDPWIQYDSTKYLIENGVFDYLHWTSTKSWYPGGVNKYELRPGLIFTGALWYGILNLLGIEITIMRAMFYFSPIMGGLTVLVMFFLGKEIMDKRTGLIAAFLLAFSPGHIQRTVAGFYDNETIGVFAVLLTFLFYVKACRTGKMSHGIMAGLAIGYLSLSWGGLTFALLLIPLLTAILILLNKYNSKILMSYVLTIGVGLLIYSINTSFKWWRAFTDMEFIIPLLFLGALIPYHFLYLRRGTPQYKQIIRWGLIVAIPAALALLIIFWVKPEWIPFGLGSRIYSILNPNIREEFHLVASVGEHLPSPWSVFYYNTLFSVLLVIPGIYFAVRRGQVQDILMIVFTLTLYYFTGSMIRIILLFAPAIALIGGYGLANILKLFGNLMKKELTITRRRKRQLKRTISKSESALVYTIVALILFVQVNHTVTIASEQLIYVELVPGNDYHDWEEALTWMKYNIDYDDPVVSWWDYGYWMTVIGNATTVNDNGTNNQTRIGLTGMAMMQTDERYSAEVFRELGAEYVMVYFGHLISGIGGDEGKWQWMLRICNDNTEKYAKMNLGHDNWYSGTQVFNEDEYVNSTSGSYQPAWFDTTLAKLMFYNEPTSVSSPIFSQGGSEIQYYYAQQIEGSADGQTPARTDDNGIPWSNYIPADGNYDLDFFEEAYFSLNSMVKIFKVDYTALDATFEIKNTNLDNEGYGWAEIENTGTLDIDINGLSINENEFDFTLENAGSSIPVGETRYLWVDTNTVPGFVESLDTYSFEITASTEREDGQGIYSFSQSSGDKGTVDPAPIALKIDKSQSRIDYSGVGENYEMYLTVHNQGTQPVPIQAFSIDDTVVSEFDLSNEWNENFLVIPGETETVYLSSNISNPNANLDNSLEVSVNSYLGESDATILGFAEEDYQLTILGDNSLQVLPEMNYLYDYSSYEEKDASTDRFYQFNDGKTYLYENGTLVVNVENTGNEPFALDGLFIDGIATAFTVDGGIEAQFMDEGDAAVVRASISGVERNTPVEVILTGLDSQTVASDAVYLVPMADSAQISIINEPDSLTTIFTDEVGRVVVKNVGNENVTLSEVVLNSTETFSLNSSNVVGGDNPGQLILQPSDIAVVEFDFITNVNLTDSVLVRINTDTAAYSEEEIGTHLPTPLNDAFNLLESSSPEFFEYGGTSALSGTNIVHIALEVKDETVVTLDAVYVKIAEAGEYQLVPFGDLTVYDNTFAQNPILDGVLTGFDADEITKAFYYIEFDANASPLNLDLDHSNEDYDTVWIKVMTVEGYEQELVISVTTS